MFKFPGYQKFCCQVVQVSRSDRWIIYHRLQELMIPCWCPEDGCLWVEVSNSLQVILVRSVAWQLRASRSDLLEWLERCWDASF